MPGFKLKTAARKLILENAPKHLFVSITFILISTLMSELQFRLPGTSDAFTRFMQRIAAGELPGPQLLYSNFRPTGAALAVLLALLLPALNAGFLSYCLKTVRETGSSYKDLLDGFQFFGKVLLIYIISTVFIFLWSMLFVFPGIVAHYRYRQAYYILLESPEKSALQCISESKRMMAGNKLDLFLLDLSFIGWYILDLAVVLLIPSPVALPIVSIWLTPYMGLTRAAYYVQLESRLVV